MLGITDQSSRSRRPLLQLIRLRFILATSLALLVTAGLLAAWYYQRTTASLEESLAARASNAAARVDLYLEEHAAGLNALALVMAESNETVDVWTQWLLRIHANYDGFITMLLADETGRVISGAPAEILNAVEAGIDVSDRDYFILAGTSEAPYMSDVFQGRGFGNDPIVAISQRFVAIDGRSYVVEGSLDLSNMRQFVAHSFAGAELTYALLDSQQTVVASSMGLAPLTRMTDAHLAEWEQSHLLVEHSLATGNWSIRTGLNRAIPLQTTAVYALVMLGGMLLCVAFGAYLFARTLRPLTNWLSQTAHELTHDDPKEISLPPVPSAGSRELDILHDRLDVLLREILKNRAMLTSRVDLLEEAVQERTRELQQHADRLGRKQQLLVRFVEDAPVALALFDRDVRYLAASRRWIEDYSIEDQDFIGRTYYEVSPPAPSQHWKRLHRRVLGGEELANDEDLLEGPDGRRRYIKWKMLPWVGDDDAVSGIMMMSQDVTEEVLVRQKLVERSDALERFNAIISDARLDPKARRTAVLQLGCEVLGLRMGIHSKVLGQDYVVESVFNKVPNVGIRQGARLALGDTVCAQVFATHTDVLHFHDQDTRRAALHPAYTGVDVSAYIGARIKTNDAVTNGTLNFSDVTPRAEPFDDYEISFVRTLANWFGSNLDREHALRRISERSSQLQTLVDALPMAVGFVDANETVELVNQQVELFGPKREEVIGQSLQAVMGNRYYAQMKDGLVAAARGKEANVEIEVEHLPGRTYMVRIVPLMAGAEQDGCCLIAFDVTPFKSRERALEAEVSTDGLTGLANRHGLKRVLNSGLDGVHAVILVDIDNFKVINDSLGHAAGDEVLRHMGGILTARAREEDEVFRYGGDEFLLIVSGTVETGKSVADRILQALEETVVLGDGREVQLQCSLGVAAIRSTFQAAFEAADRAVYHAKGLGGHRVVEATDPDHQSAPPPRRDAV